MMKSPCSQHNRKVRHMIQKGKDGWVKLCFDHDTKQRFKMKNLEWVPASESTEMKSTKMENSSIKSWISLSTWERAYWQESDPDSSESLNSLGSNSLSLSSNWLSLNSLSLSTLSKLTTVCLIVGRSLSSLEEYKSGESESSNSTLSSDVEEEDGNPLRVLTNAFVNFLEQAQ